MAFWTDPRETGRSRVIYGDFQWGFNGDLVVIYGELMGIHGHLVVIYGGLMGIHGHLVVIYGDLMGFMVIFHGFMVV